MSRLLILSTEFPPGPGGIGVHALQIALHLRHLGWEVLVLSPQDYASDAEVAPFNTSQPFAIRTFPRGRCTLQTVLHRFRFLFEALRDWKPDLVLATGERAAWLALPATFWFRFPLVIVWHGVTPTSRISHWLTSISIRRAAALVSVSEYSLSRLLDLEMRPKQWTVIPNGADVAHFFPTPELRDQEMAFRGLDSQACYLLTVGNVSDRKGQDIVIRALPRILAEFGPVHYLIAGLPTRKKEYQRLAADLGVEDNVHFLDRVPADKLNAVYNMADVFVLVSRHSPDGEYEGFGIVVVEAALCAKPAVVASNSGLAEAILAGETGLLVPEEDPEKTAEAVIRLLMDLELRQRMGEQARLRALNEQSWALCAQRFDRYFRTVLAGE